MPQSDIAVDEWLKQLEDIGRTTGPDCDGFLTPQEMAGKFGCGIKRVRIWLSIAHGMKRLESRIRAVESYSGRVFQQRVYRIKGKG